MQYAFSVPFRDETLILDFVADGMAWLRLQLAREGLKKIPADEGVLLAYFNHKHRSIEPRPRRVHLAKSYACPRPLRPLVRVLREKIESGVALRPHQSESVLKLKFHDYLLNDWGIHHLHLGGAPGRFGFVTRTGPILYAMFRSNDAYLIAVDGHGRWGHQSLIRAVDASWPELLEPFTISGISGTRQRPMRSSDTVAARSAGVQPVTILDRGRALAGVGGGITTAKVAYAVVVAGDRFVEKMLELERRALARRGSLRALASSRSLPMPATLRLEFIDAERWRARLEGTTVELPL